MGVTSKSKAQIVREQRQRIKELQEVTQDEVAQSFYEMVDTFHGMNVGTDNEIELAHLQDQIDQIKDGKKNLRGTWDNDLPTFSPSSASKSDRDLVFKLSGAPKDEKIMEAYQKRWVENGSAVHSRMQKDFLYIEKYVENAPFEIMRTKEGKPAWERNTRTVKQFEYDGEKFQIYGMVDGMLWDKVRHKRVGYDLKTKSTTIASVGDYKLKVPQENNVEQMVAYSLLFDVDEYIIHYESLAKDNWTKGKEARKDMKVFHIVITDDMRNKLLAKFARVARYYREDIIPPREPEKEFFSEYKELNKKLEEEGL